MEFELNGELVRLDELDPIVDSHFPPLFQYYFARHPNIPTEFKSATFAFFAKYPNDANLHDRFFTNLSPIWRAYQNAGRYEVAADFWRSVVEMALEWEKEHPGNFIHKGTPYYWWAVSLFSNGEVDNGYLVMHQALEEDLRTNAEDMRLKGLKLPKTPPAAFLTLDYANPNQAFREWLQRQSELLDGYITQYANKYSKNFTLRDFTERFLLNPPSVDTVFLFAYAFARVMRLEQALPKYAIQNGFAGQIERGILFDLTLVIEEAIKAKNPTPSGFRARALFLSQAASLGFTDSDFGDLNRPPANDRFSEILGRTYAHPDGRMLVPPATDIAVAYLLRNHSAHNAAPPPILWQQYKSVSQCVLNTLFLTVETLC